MKNSTYNQAVSYVRFVTSIIGTCLVVCSSFVYYDNYVIHGYGYAVNSKSTFDFLFLVGLVLMLLCFSTMSDEDKKFATRLVVCLTLSYFIGTHLVFPFIVSLSDLSAFRIFRTGINLTALSFAFSFFPGLKNKKAALRWIGLLSLLSTMTFLFAHNGILIFNKFYFDMTQFRLIQSIFVFIVASVIYAIRGIDNMVRYKETKIRNLIYRQFYEEEGE